MKIKKLKNYFLNYEIYQAIPIFTQLKKCLRRTAVVQKIKQNK